MNAYELYETAVDAKSVEERGAFDYLPLALEDLQACFDGLLNQEIAEKIIAAHKALYRENEANGKFANNYYYIIEQQLSKIEL